MNKLNEITKNFKKRPIGRLSIGKLKPMFNIFLLFFLLTQLFTSLQCGGKPEEIDNVGFGVPSGLRSEPGAGQVTLTWDPVENAIYYNVYRNDSIIADPNKTFYTDMNLESGVEYIYQVSAVDANGKEGDKSDAITVTLQFLDYSEFSCPESNFEAPAGKPLLEYVKDFTLSSDMEDILSIGNPVVTTTYPINEAEVPFLLYVDFLFSEEMEASTLTTSNFTVTLYRNDTKQSGILAKDSVSSIDTSKNIYRLSFSNSGNLQHGDRVRIELESGITDKESPPKSIRTFLPYEFYINIDSEAIKNDQIALDTSSIEFSGFDTVKNVTQSFFLPTLGKDRSSLCWQTNRSDIFQIDNETGRVEVVRPLDSGASPKLRAEVKKGSGTPLFKTLKVTTPMLPRNGSPDANSLKCSLNTPQSITDAVADPIVIPKPNSLRVSTGQFDITCNTRFASNDDTPLEHHIIGHLNKLFSEDMGFTIPVISNNTQNNLIKIDFLEGNETDAYIDDIDFIPNHTEDDEDNILRKEEAYKLEITRDGVLITAAHKRGFINAYHSLMQLFPSELQKRIDRNEINTFPLPLVSIQDRPRLVYRGHFDWWATTNAQLFSDTNERDRSIRELKKFIFGFSRYKINVFNIIISQYAIDPGPLRKPRLQIHFDAEKKNVVLEPKHTRELVGYARDRNVDLVPVTTITAHSLDTVYDPDISVLDGAQDKFSGYPTLYSPSQETFAMFKRRMTFLSRLYGSRYIHLKGDEFYPVAKHYFGASKNLYRNTMNEYNQKYGSLSTGYVDDVTLQQILVDGIGKDSERKYMRWGNPKKMIWEAERFKSLNDISNKASVARDVYTHTANQLVKAVKERGRTPIAWDEFSMGLTYVSSGASRFSFLVEPDSATIVHWWRNYEAYPTEKHINQLGRKYIFNHEYKTYFNSPYIGNRVLSWVRDTPEELRNHQRCEDISLTVKSYLPGININNSYSSYGYDVVDSDGDPTLLWGFSSANWDPPPIATDNFDRLEYRSFPRIFGIAEVGWSDRPSDYPGDWSAYSKTKPYEPWEDLKRRAQAQKRVLVNYDIKHFKPDYHGFLYNEGTLDEIGCSMVK